MIVRFGDRRFVVQAAEQAPAAGGSRQQPSLVYQELLWRQRPPLSRLLTVDATLFFSATLRTRIARFRSQAHKQGGVNQAAALPTGNLRGAGRGAALLPSSCCGGSSWLWQTQHSV
jgi:hypothetical protein